MHAISVISKRFVYQLYLFRLIIFYFPRSSFDQLNFFQVCITGPFYIKIMHAADIFLQIFCQCTVNSPIPITSRPYSSNHVIFTVRAININFEETIRICRSSMSRNHSYLLICISIFKIYRREFNDQSFSCPTPSSLIVQLRIGKLFRIDDTSESCTYFLTTIGRVRHFSLFFFSKFIVIKHDLFQITFTIIIAHIYLMLSGRPGKTVSTFRIKIITESTIILKSIRTFNIDLCKQ